MDRSTASRLARNSDSVMIVRRRPASRPSRRRWRLASSRVDPRSAVNPHAGQLQFALQIGDDAAKLGAARQHLRK